LYISKERVRCWEKGIHTGRKEKAKKRNMSHQPSFIVVRGREGKQSEGGGTLKRWGEVRLNRQRRQVMGKERPTAPLKKWYGNGKMDHREFK